MNVVRQHGNLWIVKQAVAVLYIVALGAVGAETTTEMHSPLPATLAVFPADESLHRPEDGIALPGGALLVTDQRFGLRLLQPDGSSEPFGQMNAAGYSNVPPEFHGAANGISLEPGGTHVLVADILGGGIYRVALKDGATNKLYQHDYGVNTALRDETGAIWFTQSAYIGPHDGEARMWAAIDLPVKEGALWRLAADEVAVGRAREVLTDLQFANGLAIDAKRGRLYVAETVGERVLSFALDVESGTLSDRRVLIDGIVPDNLELDGAGMLLVAAPLPNTVFRVDPETGESHSLLPAPTENRLALLRLWKERAEAAQSRMDLITPDAWAPTPGFITGVVTGTDGKVIYLTGLGNALLKLIP